MCAVLIATLAMGSGCPAFAANPAAPTHSTPDVLVLVLSVMEPYDYVSINYTSAVPKQQAQADLQSLIKETGWKVGNVDITTKSIGTPGAVPTTSTVFQTFRISDSVQGTLPLSPFVDVLKRFKTIEVTYATRSGFRFAGLRDYTSPYADVKLKESGRSYTYRVTIKNAGFTHINLPLKPAVKPVPKQAAPMPAGARALLIAAIAILGAVVAYFVTMLISNRRNR